MKKSFSDLRRELDDYYRQPREQDFIDTHYVDIADYPEGTERQFTGEETVSHSPEQIDEISKKKLGQYLKKASDDMAMKADKAGREGKHAGFVTYKRRQGVHKAIDRLAKEELDIATEETMTKAQITKRDEIADAIIKDNKADMKKRYGDDWKNVAYAIATKQVMKEGVGEDIQEISKAAMKKYGQAAMQDVLALHDKRSSTSDPEEKKNISKKIAKRDAGMRMAFSKGKKLREEKKLDDIGKEDGDIDNDGDVDASDKYLKKRRSAISKDMKKEEVENLDEISIKKLDAYADAAAKDVVKGLGKRVPNPATGGRTFKYVPPTPDESKKASKRATYMGKAIRKMGDKRKKMKEDLSLDEAYKPGKLTLNDGSSVKLSKQDAELLNKMMKDLNAKNKKNMETVLKTDEAGFEEILGFAREAL